MAFVGLANPYIAKLVDEGKKKYSGCFACGEAISVSVTPNYNEAKLYANNRLKDMVKEFKDGAISLGTDHLPIAASEVCFGHEVDQSGRTVTYRTDDEGEFVGVGFYVDIRISSRKEYEATVIYKVKFSESTNEHTTKGETLEFKTPTIEGTIAGLKTGEWKITKTFDDAADADKWLRDTLGLEEPSVTPPETPGGGDQGGTSGGEESKDPSEPAGDGDQGGTSGGEESKDPSEPAGDGDQGGTSGGEESKDPSEPAGGGQGGTSGGEESKDPSEPAGDGDQGGTSGDEGSGNQDGETPELTE